MAVAARALKSVYLLCARFFGETATKAFIENPAPGFAEGWQMALAYTMVSHSE